MVSTPGLSVATYGAWPANTPNSPSSPGTSTWLTSPAKTRRSGDTSSKWNVAMTGDLCGLRGEFLALVDCLLDGSDHVEGRFRQVIILAVAQPLETPDGVGQIDEDSLGAGEHLRDMERLRQEALNLAGASDRQLVFFGELVHAEDGDDVLERLIALQHLLDLARHAIVLIADHERSEHPRGRIERVHGRVDTLFGDAARQHRGGVEVRE